MIILQQLTIAFMGFRVNGVWKEDFCFVIVIVIFNQGVHSVKLIFSGAVDKHTI